jgi:release factor glutamine methyltransferase
MDATSLPVNGIESFDLIISNPPYIRSSEITLLQPEVSQFDPRVALDGGEDGLQYYRAFAPVITAALNPCGLVVLEVGAGQVEDVVNIMAESKLEMLVTHKDIADIERAIVFQHESVSQVWG